MSVAADKWRSFSNQFTRFGRHIDQARTVNINASVLREEARAIAQQYFREIRPLLQDHGPEQQLEALNLSFQSLLELSDRVSGASSYKKHIKNIRKLMPKITSHIELNVGSVAVENTHENQRVIETLENLVVSAALSYKQAAIDLKDNNRVSFRGPALELREALRETLDHLAPDAAVMSMDGYAQEKGRSGPTMKQKVRFILRSRGQKKSASSVPEQTANTVEELVGSLTRSVYEMSSVATHVASERRAVLQIQRYVTAILHDILEL